MPQVDSFSSQDADYKSETQLKTRSPREILQKLHPDLDLYLYVLEIHEHVFFKKLAINGCFSKKKKKKQKETKKKRNNRKNTKSKNKNKNKQKNNNNNKKQQQQQQQQQKI